MRRSRLYTTIRVMTGKSWRTFGIRTSDLEREDIAHRIEAANGEGRLTLSETDRRLALAYSATYRYELQWLVADLPATREVAARTPGLGTESRDAKIWLGAHVGLVALFSVLLVYRWSNAGISFFWPMIPMFWLAASLVVHAWLRLSGRFVGRVPNPGRTWWPTRRAGRETGG
jgi:hypothetical protein